MKRFFNFMRGNKEVVEKTPEQKVNIDQVNARHRKRIGNLTDEAEILVSRLKSIESDENLHPSEKSKRSDSIIQRLVQIKYEIGIREDLISWL